MAKIKLNQQLGRVEIEGFEMSNELVFNYFNSLPVSEREDKLFRALYIGVLASMENRLAAFFAKTSNELGTELESLKLIFEMKKELFYKTTVKGSMAEEDIANYLNQLFQEKKLKDSAVMTGNESGKLHKNKTGDIVCAINGTDDLKIVIECKFDKSIKLGEIESKDVFTKKMDTAWSQLIEAEVNRTARASIIVFDRSFVDSSILKKFDNVGFVPSVGFIAIIDSEKNEYMNLAISYMLARDIALNAKKPDLDLDLLALMISRIVKDINEVKAIKDLVEGNIQNNKEILKQLEKSVLLMEFNQEYLKKFIQDGSLTKEDLLNFYMSEDVKDKYKLIEKEIDERY